MTADPSALQRLRPHLLDARTLARRKAPDRTLRPTSLAALDALLDGGLCAGSLIEVVGRRSCGRFSTLLHTLAGFTRRGEVAALVDLGDGLEPRSALDAGIEPSRLLWVRPRRLKQALIATELLLDTGFPLVVLDLGLPPVPGGRGPEASWMRLARAAQRRRGVLLVSSPYRASGTAAQAVVESNKVAAEWRGSGRTPRLLGGLAARLQLAKALGRGPTPAQSLRWRSTPFGG